MRKDKVADNGDEQAVADDLHRPPDEQQEDVNAPEEREPVSRPLFRIIGIIFIALAVIVGVYGTVAYLAWQRSQEAQAQEAEDILLEEIEAQLSLAAEDIAAGKLLLAQRRLEWILQRKPDHSESLQLMAEIESQLALPTATPIPTPTAPAVVEEEDPDDALAPAFTRLQGLVGDGEWSEAITALIAFQSENPDYRRQDTDQLLYDAYVNLGQSLLSGDQVELGLNYLSQAEALGDLSQEVKDQRSWAELYLAGIAYYGVNWELAASFFRDLCAAAPFYQNACQKLGESLVALGDINAANLEWCPAAAFYAEARSINGDVLSSDKLANARLMCLEATPTPTAPITATQDISGTLLGGSEGQGNDDG